MSGSNPGSAVNSGSSASARLIFTVPERVRQLSMSSTNVVGELRSLDLLQERDLRVDRGDHERRRQLLAAVERHADRAAVADQHALDARVRADLGAERLRGRGARVADRAHAALGIAPARDLAVADVADRVVHHHVRRAGRIGTRPRADDPVHRLQADEHLVLEPAAQQVGRAHREQPRDVGDRLLVDLLAELPGELRDVLDVGGLLRPDVRRRLHQQRAHDVRDAADPRLELRPLVGVVLGELRDRLVVLAPRRPTAGSSRRGAAGSRAPAGRPCSRTARARGRAGSTAASGSSRS